MESCGLAMRSAVIFMAFLSTLIAVPVSIGLWYSLVIKDTARFDSVLRASRSMDARPTGMRLSSIAFSIGVVAFFAAAIVAYYGYFASLQLGLLVIGILCVVISAWTGMRTEGQGKASLRLGWILLGVVNLVGWCIIGVVVYGSGARCLWMF